MATEEAKWYVVHTYSGYENKVAQNIEKEVEVRGIRDQILDVRIPTGVFDEVKDDKKVEVERKLFPGYVLVKMVMNAETWYIARNTRGVTGFVGPGSKPVPLSDQEVEALGIDVHTIEISYNVGDTVKIIDGSFEGFTGKVSEISKERGKVSVIITMMGRETAVEFDWDQIAAIEE